MEPPPNNPSRPLPPLPPPPPPPLPSLPLPSSPSLGRAAMATASSMLLQTGPPPPLSPPPVPMTSTSDWMPTQPQQQIVRQLVAQLSESMHSTLRQVAQQYGIPDTALLSTTAMATAPTTTPTTPTTTPTTPSQPEDTRVLVQELQKAKRNERALQLLVDDLQTEQRVAKERLALYSIFALKLKRELINEKLAHIDSKKEMDEVRAQYEGEDASGQPPPPGSPEARGPAGGGQRQRRGSYEADAAAARRKQQEDLWTSPNKPAGDRAAASGGGGSGLQLSFGSFYSSRQPPPPPAVDEEDDDDESGRNSLMDQFLPSTLLDSPQLTPKASRAQPRDNQDDTRNDEDTACPHRDRHLAYELETELTSLVLSPARSTTAKEEETILETEVDHASRPPSSDSTSTIGSTTVSTSTATFASVRAANAGVAPLTLSLLGEMLESITMDEVEVFLREANGHVSGAIERILQRHPSFNPALAAEVSVMAGPGVGKHHSLPLQRSASASAAVANQQASQSSGATPGGTNWKTEMCMYYLQGKCNKTRRTCSFAHGESDLVRTMSVKHTSSTSYKSRMCPQWLEGSCPKSRRECALAHGENDLRDGLALLGQNAVGASGGASGAASGGIAAPTLPTTAPRLQNYKTELCYYYLKGCCNFTTEECRFAHGESDLRTVESNTLEWSTHAAGVGGTAGYMPDAYAADKTPSVSMQQPPQHHQHQFQHQYVGQFQPAPLHQQVIGQQHAPFALTPHQPPFVPHSHQYHPLPPTGMHARQPPPLAAPHHQPAYRYMKSMDDAKPPRRPAPPRREATWAQPSYDAMGPELG